MNELGSGAMILFVVAMLSMGGKASFMMIIVVGAVLLMAMRSAPEPNA